MKARFFALAALVLGLASCQNDFDGANVGVGGEVDFQLAVSAPEFGATRADADGSNGHDSAFGAIDYLSEDEWANVDLRYTLEVYDYNPETKTIGDAPVKDRMVKVLDKYEPVVFELRLVPGRHYHFVVFADFVDEDATDIPTVQAQAEIGKHHIIGTTLAEITLDADAINNELTDAYFATAQFEITNSAAKDMILRRPYGKVRVVATDLAELNLNVNPQRVQVDYTTKIPTTFNAVTGEVDTRIADKTYVAVLNVNKEDMSSHLYTDGYDSLYTTNANGDKRYTHVTLFTDYVLAEKEGQTPHHFTMTVFDDRAGQNPIKTTIFSTDIPVQRNHLTTVIGNVLTTGTEINVTINDNFYNADNIEDAPYYQVAVTNGVELVKALYEGREIIVLNDITVTAADVEAYLATTRTSTAINPVLNLNGYTLTFVNNGDDALLTVAEGSSLTIEDNVGTGAVVLEGKGNAIENNGELNINNTTLTSNGEGSVIENKAEVNIEGSTLNEGALENNGEANIADSTLNAGSVENNGTANLNGGDVADDAVENGDDAIVGTYVYTAEELQAAINAAEVGLNNEVSFGDDIVGEVTILQKEGVNLIINGRDFEFDGVITVNGGGRAAGKETLTFKAINFATEGSDFTFISAPSKINGAYNYSHNVTVENCTFKGNHTVGCVSFTGTYNFVLRECKAENVHSIAQFQSCDNTVLVEDIEVVSSKNGLSFGNTAYPTLRNAVIEATGYGVRADGDASRGALLLEGNTIEANVPVIVRKTTTKYDVTLVNNAITITKDGLFEVVFTNGKDDEEYVAPTGTYTITGADDYMVYPRNSVANWDEFVATTASKVVLLNDITYNKSYTITKDITLDLNGKTFAIDNVSAMLNIGDSKNSSKPNVTIKNGNFNTIIYALSGNVTIQDVVFGGTISYVSASQGVVSTKYANLLMENCKMTNVKKSGTTKPRSLCTEGRSSGSLILRNCNFKNSNLDRPYINPLNGTATLELTNCSLYGGATNIDLGASLVWSNTNLNLNGCSGGFTFTISRASTSLTEDELAVYRAIKKNNSGSMRFIFTDGEKNNL